MSEVIRVLYKSLIILLIATWLWLTTRTGSDASSEKSLGTQSTGSENIGISSKNTLLAMDTSGRRIKKAMNKITDDMRIDETLFNPDSLWQRGQAGWVLDLWYLNFHLKMTILQKTFLEAYFVIDLEWRKNLQNHIYTFFRWFCNCFGVFSDVNLHW